MTTSIAAAVLGATGTSADSCFNEPLTSANTANVISRGVDLELAFLPSAADRLSLTLELLPKSQLTGVNGIATISAADVQAAAAANAAAFAANASTGTAAQQLATATAIAATFNSQLASVTGGILQQSPKTSIDAAYSHTFTFSGGSRLTPRLNYVYKSAYWIAGGGPNGASASAIANATIAINSGVFWGTVQPSYSLVNAYATWESSDGKWSINGYVSNIGNKAILVDGGPSVTAASTPGNVVVTGGSVTLSAPRLYGLTVSANF